MTTKHNISRNGLVQFYNANDNYGERLAINHFLLRMQTKKNNNLKQAPGSAENQKL